MSIIQYMATLLEYYNIIAGVSIQSHHFDQLFVSLRQLLMPTNISVLLLIAQCM